LRVSSRQSFTDARLLRSFERAHTNTQIIDMLMAQLGIRAQALRLDSQAKYALLAAGGGEIMIRLPPEENPGYKEKIWDQAAGALIVEEAGGRISDLSGQPLDFTWGRTLQRNRGVLATNGLLHEPLLNKLAQVAS
jgi:3'(2'), 5'-bisphosphate nucleotidase